MSRRPGNKTSLSGSKTPLSGTVDATGGNADILARSTATKHTDELLDQALADSFPASDPVSTLSTDAPPASHADTHLLLLDKTRRKAGKK